VAALLVVALGATLWALWPASAVERPPVRLSVVGPEAETIFRGYGSSVAISPDGSRLVYVLEKVGERKLYLRNLDRWESTVLVGAGDGPYHPFFSPDGQWLGFVTRTELKKVPVRGGPPLTLCDVELNRGSSWGRDGSIIFAPSPSSGLFRVAAAGGDPEPLTELDEERKETSHRWPQVLPGGKAVLFTARTERGDYDGSSIEVLDLDSGERRTLQRGGTYGRYVRSGHVVYANRDTLFAFPFDLGTLQATGSPAPVLEGVATNASQGGAHFDVSEDGTLAYNSGTDTAGGATVVWVDADGNASPLWDTPQDYANPMISPDGSRVALEVSQEGEKSIWIYDLGRDVPMRLTVEEGHQIMPIWTPDGKTIYYAGWNPDAYGIYRRPADGSGEPERIFPSDEGLLLYGISPDETTLTVGKGMDVWVVDLEAGKATPLLEGDWIEGQARFSPDGRWIAYNSNESGRFEVYVRPASGGRGKWQISTGGGSYPHWSGDGRTLYYRVPGGGVLRARVDTSGGGLQVGREEPVFDAPYLWAGDGTDRWDVDPTEERFLMLQPQSGEDTGHPHIRVVLDWFDDLRRTFAETGAGR
jgi:serine/threonine-protein kinase